MRRHSPEGAHAHRPRRHGPRRLCDQPPAGARRPAPRPRAFLLNPPADPSTTPTPRNVQVWRPVWHPSSPLSTARSWNGSWHSPHTARKQATRWATSRCCTSSKKGCGSADPRRGHPRGVLHEHQRCDRVGHEMPANTAPPTTSGWLGSAASPRRSRPFHCDPRPSRRVAYQPVGMRWLADRLADDEVDHGRRGCTRRGDQRGPRRRVRLTSLSSSTRCNSSVGLDSSSGTRCR